MADIKKATLAELSKEAQDYLQTALPDGGPAGWGDLPPWEAAHISKAQWQNNCIAAAEELGDLEGLRMVLADPATPQVGLRAAKRILAIGRATKQKKSGHTFDECYEVAKKCWELELKEFPEKNPTTVKLDAASRDFTAALWACKDYRDETLKFPGVRNFIEKYSRIRTKKAQVVPFRLNHPQRMLFDTLTEIGERKSPRGVNLILLKARQEGFSTAIIHILTTICLVRPNVSLMSVAHKEDSKGEEGALANFYNMADLYLRSLPYPPPRILKSGGSWKTGLKLDQPLGSMLGFGSASGSDISSGTTRHGLHLSELAKWLDSNVRETFNSLNQAFAKDTASLRIIEFTAKKMNFAHDLFMNAEQYGFDALFFPWWLAEDYVFPLTNPESYIPPEKVSVYFKEHPEIPETCRTPQRMAWVDLTLRQDFKNNFDDFKQEYPSTPTEAFLAGAESAYFDLQRVAVGRNKTEPPIWQGDIFIPPEALASGRVLSHEDVSRTEDRNGAFRIWVEPDQDHCYILGVDPCAGETIRGDSSDAGVIQVMDADTEELVALYHGRVSPEEMLGKVLSLALLYHGLSGAFLIPASFNYGMPMISRLVDEEDLFSERIGYAIYFQEMRDRQTKQVVGTQYGFRESSATRPGLYSELKQWLYDLIDDPSRRVHQDILIHEALHFIIQPNLRCEAAHGEHDDVLTATALCVAALHSIQFRGIEHGGRGRPVVEVKEEKVGELFHHIERLRHGTVSDDGFDPLPEFKPVGMKR